MEITTARFTTSNSQVCRKASYMSSCFPNIAPASGLGPLWRYWISAASIISSWPSVFYERIPYAVQEWHGGSSFCGRWPTSSGTNHRPGSVSSAVGGALRLDAGPHTSPPSALIISTAASSLGISGCSGMDSISSGLIRGLRLFQTGLYLFLTDFH
jgi:hypothetical protein